MIYAMKIRGEKNNTVVTNTNVKNTKLDIMVDGKTLEVMKTFELLASL